MTALIAANWKMNASLAANEALLSALAAGMASKPACDVALCIPAPYMAQFAAGFDLCGLGRARCLQPAFGCFHG
jgi:triosephosphate isomerase